MRSIFAAASALLLSSVLASPVNRGDDGPGEICPGHGILGDPYEIGVYPDEYPKLIGWVGQYFLDVQEWKASGPKAAVLTTSNGLNDRFHIDTQNGTIAALMGECNQVWYYLNINETGKSYRSLVWQREYESQTWAADYSGAVIKDKASGSSSIIACQTDASSPWILYLQTGDDYPPATCNTIQLQSVRLH